MLLAAALMSALLTAAAVAMHAAMESYEENEKIAAAVQTQRSILDRIVRQIRTAAAVTSDSFSLHIIPPDDGSGLQEIIYEYHGFGSLYYTEVRNGEHQMRFLIDYDDEVKVQEFAVLREIGKDWQGVDCTKSVTIRMVVSVEGQQHAMTATASPRRNQTY